MARSAMSILANARPSDVRSDPYPYLVVQNALDPGLFDRLSAEFPAAETVMNGRSKADTWYAYPACQAVEDSRITGAWQEFMRYHTSRDFYLDFLELFAGQLERYYPALDKALPRAPKHHSVAMRQLGESGNPTNRASDASLECQFYVNLTEKPRTVRGPHVDRPTELFAGLLYFRRADDSATGGELEVCRALDPRGLYPARDAIRVDHLPMEVERDRVEIVESIPYRANTLVMFLNTFASLHSISVRSATPVPRQHVNFTADLFNLPLPGLFSVRYPKSKQVKKWLTRQPVAWRLAQLIDD
jgi:hypothetical protein